MAGIKRVRALTFDGNMSMCSVPPHERGKGKCNHIAHQKDNESEKSFIKRALKIDDERIRKEEEELERQKKKKEDRDRKFAAQRLKKEAIKEEEDSKKSIELKMQEDFSYDGIGEGPKNNSQIAREHNRRAYFETIEAFNKSDRCVVLQPTGSGKSAVISAVLDDYKDKNIIILAPTNNIINESYKAFKSGEGGVGAVYHYTYQKIIASFRKDNFEEINTDNIGIIALDEAHRLSGNEWEKAVKALIEKCDKPKILGATATPMRADKSNVAINFFNGVSSSNLSFEEALEKDIIETPKYVAMAWNYNSVAKKLRNKVNKSASFIEDRHSKERILKEIEELSKITEKEDIKEVFDEFLIDTLKERIKIGEDPKILFFCSNKSEAEKIKKEIGPLIEQSIRDSNLEVEVSEVNYFEEHSDSVFEEYKSKGDGKQIKIMYSVDKFNEGIHIGNLDTVILTRPTTSKPLHMQQIGRVLSKKKSGIKPLILDLTGNAESVESQKMWERISKNIGTKENQIYYDRMGKSQELRKKIELDYFEVTNPNMIGTIYDKDGNAERVKFNDLVKERNWRKSQELIFWEKITEGFDWHDSVRFAEGFKKRE